MPIIAAYFRRIHRLGVNMAARLLPMLVLPDRPKQGAVQIVAVAGERQVIHNPLRRLRV
jgi:hypothetical protein